MGRAIVEVDATRTLVEAAKQGHWRPLTLSEAHAVWQRILCDDLFATDGPPVPASPVRQEWKRWSRNWRPSMARVTNGSRG